MIGNTALVEGTSTRRDATNRVLVVEDDQGIREPLADLLRGEGYEITLAENGQEALRTLRTGRAPNLIVLDLRMPVMDGWEFRAIQREDPTWRLIPVIAISADASAQAVAISADAYLRKPVDPGELLRTIERILFEEERRAMTARLEHSERLAAIGRAAAGVGHEINNPLAFVMLNLGQALTELRHMGAETSALASVVAVLEECQAGLDRIRRAMSALQGLPRRDETGIAPLDVEATAAPGASTATKPPTLTLTLTPLATATATLPRRSRVLVIDDEPAIGVAIRAVLRSEHDVVVAQRATEAFAWLEAGETFDLILCDMVMPDIGGAKVYATIAQRWPALTRRLIFMTGGAYTDEASSFIDRALTPVVFKPFRLDELRALVRQHLTAKN